MRYTHYDEDLKRWVVECREKADGETIKFYVKHDQKEITGVNTDIVRLSLASVLVFGEAINRLAELENAAEKPASKHGEWKKRGNEKKCSRCEFIYYSNNDEWSFCPNCGAKMDGERKEQR